jgi:hypothetical protein
LSEQEYVEDARPDSWTKMVEKSMGGSRWCSVSVVKARQKRERENDGSLSATFGNNFERVFGERRGRERVEVTGQDEGKVTNDAVASDRIKANEEDESGCSKQDKRWWP